MCVSHREDRNFGHAIENVPVMRMGWGGAGGGVLKKNGITYIMIPN